MVELQERMRCCGSVAESSLPLPGHGSTPVRHRALLELGRKDLSLARMAEAHTDALAILAEAGHRARPDSLYGVWASDGPHSRVAATRLRNGNWRLDGIKQYCGGATFLTCALITARVDDAVRLFEVPLDHPGVRPLASTWATPALSDTATGPVALEAVTLSEGAVVGDDNWYLDRPGFWHGAIGPAACWAGGAQSLVDAAAALERCDAHSRAHVGALHAISWGFLAALDQAGREIDDDPADERGRGRVRALKVRHLIERWCTETLDRFGRATGPQLLCSDPQIARQHMALTLYLRQCHAERDLEAIAAAGSS